MEEKIKEALGVNSLNGATFFMFRNKFGYNQQEFAEKLNVNQRTLNQWEKNKREIPLAIWETVADINDLAESNVGNTIDAIYEIIDRMENTPNQLQYTYFRNQEQYDQFGREPGDYKIANYTTREVAEYMYSMEDIIPSFSYPDDSDNIYHSTKNNRE